MKIAILSDVHANYLALQAVAADVDAWQPDLVYVAGDLVNRGPRPLECLELVQARQHSHGWQIILGNHEEYVMYQDRPDAPRSGPAAAVHQASYWTYQRLGEQVNALRSLPFASRIQGPDGGTVCVTHASLLGTRDGVYHKTSDEELAKKIGDPPALFLVGHTHIPLIRHLNGTLVVNAGSAGLPFDRDHRPSYARLSWVRGAWQAEIQRVAYDYIAAERDFVTSGYLDQAGSLIPLVVRELRQARAWLGGWAGRYQDRVLAGEIDMPASVAEFLRATE